MVLFQVNNLLFYLPAAVATPWKTNKIPKAFDKLSRPNRSTNNKAVKETYPP